MFLVRKTLVAAALLGLFFPALSLRAESKEQVIVEWNSKTTPTGLAFPKVTSFVTSLSSNKKIRFFSVFDVPKNSTKQKVIEYFKSLSGVTKVEENFIYNTVEVSNDPLYTDGSTWGMYSNDEPVVGPPSTTNQYGSQSEQAWNRGYVGSRKVVVAVIDTGVDYTHPDLYLNIYLNQGEIKNLSFFNSLNDTDSDGIISFVDLNDPSNSTYVSDLNSNGRIDAGDLLADPRWANGIDNDSNGFIDDLAGWDFLNNDNNPIDDNRHGTHVSGTVAGIGGNGVGVAGVVWKTQIMPLKFLSSSGWGYLSDAVRAIDYLSLVAQAQDRAYNSSSNLTFLGSNNSWGGGSYSSILETSIKNGALLNLHFVAAAGNNSSNIDVGPFYPASYSTLPEAGWEAVTSVASLNSDGSLSSFSNYGTSRVDLGAPGGYIMSSLPSSNFGYLSGTSMATPHVMGSLVSFASSFPQASRRELREVLLSTTTPTSSLSGKVATQGRLNVANGLTELERRYPSTFPTYSLNSPASVYEGFSLLASVTTTEVGNGTVLYWSLTGVQSSDLVNGALRGSTAIFNNGSTITLPIAADNIAEQPETLTLNLYSNSARTNLLASRSVSLFNSIWGSNQNNSITGTNNPESIAGVSPLGTDLVSLGKNQVDTLSGRAGADLFLLGQTRLGTPRVFYNGGNSTSGSTDYAIIADFNPVVDKVYFSTGRYFTQSTASGTNIYWDRNNNGFLDLSGLTKDEFIGLIRGLKLGNLTITSGSLPSWAIMGN